MALDFAIIEWTEARFQIRPDSGKLKIDVIHDYLSNHSYWSIGIPKSQVERFIKYSLCFGVYDRQFQGRQIGFARAITDGTTFAYMADVFILEAYRGQGLGKWLINCILSHPDLQGLRTWVLKTKDAHGLYERFGFQPNPEPENLLVYRLGFSIKAKDGAY